MGEFRPKILSETEVMRNPGLVLRFRSEHNPVIEKFGLLRLMRNQRPLRTLGPRLNRRSPEFPVNLSALPSGDACSGFRLPVFLRVFAGKTGTGICLPEEISQELIALAACSANLTDDVVHSAVWPGADPAV